MSYCRWSTDDFQCDLYVYESVGGFWSTNVAGNRIVYKEPLPAPVPYTAERFREWLERDERVFQMIDEADRIDIDLPHAGESFEDPTPGACADRLEYLKGLGYRFPDDVIEALREEQEERGRAS
ncbi:hypothetical protein [Luteibacter sp. SG786]|uniref:hypothetical protein n=1 Tax=Luteibacter sp. SG786 TaxID=2587130 RepID=UPI001420CCA9|nr:hypothetical protein [Luteibacter sp. SG786]NII53536.1 hypothetical protein [Luteibacter sp. SG786]